jgi:hypothetical protein
VNDALGRKDMTSLAVYSVLLSLWNGIGLFVEASSILALRSSAQKKRV